MKVVVGLLFLIYCSINSSFSQEVRTITLEEAINLAQDKSLDAFISKHMYLKSYCEFKAYQASRKPWLSLYADPVIYNNSISKVTETSGTSLVRSESFETNGNISLSQTIAPTGGNVFINSSFDRLLDYEYDNTYYSSVPVSIGFSQPLFQFNKYKWERKLEPLKFEKAKLEYISSSEELAIKTIGYYFNLIDAKLSYNIALGNSGAADSLYYKSKGRFERGAISFNDLQRLELNKINAKIVCDKSKLYLQQVDFQFKTFLRLPTDINLELILPLDIPKIKINPQEALEKSLINNPIVIGFKQSMIQADREIAKVKGDYGITSTITSKFGFSQSGNSVHEAYNDLDKDRRVSLGLYIPIINWGMRDKQLELRKSNKEIVTAQIEMDRISFEQNVIMSTLEFNMKESILESAQKANIISEKTYTTTEESFLLGKSNLETLYAARNERDNALRAYYNSIRESWNSYYLIRYITLYDFWGMKSLSKEFDDKLDIK